MVSIAGLVTTASASVVPAWWANRRERDRRSDEKEQRAAAAHAAERDKLTALATEIAEASARAVDVDEDGRHTVVAREGVKLLALLRRGTIELPGEPAAICWEWSRNLSINLVWETNNNLPKFVQSVRELLHDEEVVAQP